MQCKFKPGDSVRPIGCPKAQGEVESINKDTVVVIIKYNIFGEFSDSRWEREIKLVNENFELVE